MSLPLISVIIPTYNAANYLPVAINSVLAQNYQPLEIIVVDDGSTDNTADVVSSFGTAITSYTYQENGGPSAARNTALAQAHGEFVASIDADDWWSEDKLSKQLALLQANPNRGIVLGLLQYMRPATLSQLGPYQPYLDPWAGKSFGAALIRRTVFDQVGLLDLEMIYFEDVDWFLRADEAGIMRHTMSETTLFYRRHAHNMTRDKEKNRYYMLKTFQKVIARSRAAKRG